MHHDYHSTNVTVTGFAPSKPISAHLEVVRHQNGYLWNVWVFLKKEEKQYKTNLIGFLKNTDIYSKFTNSARLNEKLNEKVKRAELSKQNNEAVIEVEIETKSGLRVVLYRPISDTSHLIVFLEN